MCTVYYVPKRKPKCETKRLRDREKINRGINKYYNY